MLCLACLSAFAPLSLKAFPPAPYYTIYGEARDAYGDLIPAEGAAVVLYQGGKEIHRRTLVNITEGDYNYQLRIRLDMMRLGTSSYSALSLNPGDTYTVAIEVGGQLFYPIQVVSPPQVGNPADRRRLDLTLGVDSDGDGLPDAWEEAQLFHAGYTPGPDGWDLSQIDRESDLDENGISNWAQYTAGTYATDSEATLSLEIKERLGAAVRLEFYAIYNRLYWLEASTNLVDWEVVPFADSEAGLVDDSRTVLLSENTGIVSIYAAAYHPRSFYRLKAK